ncbi:MAG: RsmE family RNA methyltransferase [Ilumatobacteraceae bacterium]
MNEVLRRAAAHVVVADVGAPVLADRAAHHLFRVLRVRDGETVTVTDGAGAWRSCRATADTLLPDGDIVEEPAPWPPIELYVAIPKQDRPDWVVQKATELGVDRVVLLHAERSVVRWEGERATRHLDKLRTVVLEASMQSRRVWIPVVEGVVPAIEVLTGTPGGLAVAEPGGRAPGPGDHRLAIGPEGGWSPAELAAAADRVDLGPNVLRVETAALAACVRLTAARTGAGTREP